MRAYKNRIRHAQAAVVSRWLRAAAGAALGLTGLAAAFPAQALPWGVNAGAYARHAGGEPDDTRSQALLTPVDGGAASYASAGPDCVGFGCKPTATARAMVGLPTGALAVTASAGPGDFASAEARLVDSLTFDAAGAADDALTLIVLKLTLRGSLLSPDAAAGHGIIMSFGGSQFALIVQKPSPVASSAEFNGWAGGTSLAGNDDAMEVTGGMLLVGRHATMSLNVYVSANAFDGFAAYDVALSLTLPDHVTFSAASGLFAGQSAASVPEPPVCAVTALAMLALGFTRHMSRPGAGMGS